MSALWLNIGCGIGGLVVGLMLAQFLWRTPNVRGTRPLDVVQLGNRLYTVIAVSFPDGVQLEPLGETLARNMRVADHGEIHTLRDVLLNAGWTEPGDGEW